MLDFQKDRLDYGAMLCPPEGYQLDRALATTYSLDLNALLAIPVALFYAQTLEGDLSGERLALLEAVRQLGEKVTLFHQAGKVQVPAQYNRLYAYLEDCLVPVVPQSPGQSFHPKIWVIRFLPEHQDNPVRFRLLVLSRNLTFDRSWDLAASLEGEVTEQPQPVNSPLVDFLHYLLEQKEETSRDERAFLQQLGKVDFKVPAGFATLKFHPIGIPGHTGGVPDYNPEHLVIVSPFVQDAPLQKFLSDDLQQAFLFSRYEELHGLSPETLSAYNAYHLNPVVVDGERALDIEGDIDSQDIHAKLFVQTRKGRSRWLLGSANATSPASGGRNVEFMLELSGHAGAIQGPRLVETLLGEDLKKGIFVAYQRPEDLVPDPTTVALERRLRSLENRLVNTGLRGELNSAANGVNYDLLVTAKSDMSIPQDFRIEVYPLGHEKLKQPFSGSAENPLHFDNLALVDLSRFVAVSIRHPALLETRRFLLQLDVALPQERLSRIFTLLLKNQARFFEYLRFLLAQNPDKDLLLSGTANGKGDSTGLSGHFAVGAVYEDLLIAASRSPEKLQSVDAVLRRLQAESAEEVIVPPEFLEFWGHFKEYLPDG